MELEEAKKVLLIIQDKIILALQFKENDIRLQGCVNAIDTVMTELKKQEKIIELMAEYISIQKWGNDESKESVIHYFKKKAKGE